MLKNANAENKITSIAYKLLNALKVGDVNQFMDTIMRIYLSYEIEIPSTFVKMMGDKEIFFPVGYSFLNGLLEREKEGNIND
jgi:CRISPR-associated protein Cst1